jgi:hypothetical protein
MDINLFMYMDINLFIYIWGLIKHLCWWVTSHQHINFVGGQQPLAQMNHCWLV